MIVRNTVWHNAYHDSVTLMLASGCMREVAGVQNAAVMMGTDHNRALMQAAGLLAEGTAFTPNDAVVGILAENEEAADRAAAELAAFFAKKDAGKQAGAQRPKTVGAAIRQLPGANLAMISVPGRYARVEAAKALDSGLHVLLFSDNVPVADEVALKEKARDKGLLMMGPDCGTAIVGGAALGFANVVRRGNIGIAAAAGTGLQEVCVLIDRFGGGVSQALGTGGRDLKREVGGIMMLMELAALRDDGDTDVIVVVSKPPHPAVTQRIADCIAAIDKPVIACLMGGAPEDLAGSGALFAGSLEQAARLAVAHAGDAAALTGCDDMADLGQIAARECAKMGEQQKCLRALYSGGTLCYESLLALKGAGLPVRSNIAVDPADALADLECSRGHTLLDMGDDYFTDGRPHPMIDPAQRAARIAREGEDPETAVLLLDIVCGYGGHPDPVRALLPAIQGAQRRAAERGGFLSVVASVCATERDPQPLGEQRRLLEGIGAVVMPSNIQAANLVTEMLRRIAKRGEISNG